MPCSEDNGCGRTRAWSDSYNGQVNMRLRRAREKEKSVAAVVAEKGDYDKRKQMPKSINIIAFLVAHVLCFWTHVNTSLKVASLCSMVNAPKAKVIA